MLISTDWLIIVGWNVFYKSLLNNLLYRRQKRLRHESGFVRDGRPFAYYRYCVTLIRRAMGDDVDNILLSELLLPQMRRNMKAWLKNPFVKCSSQWALLGIKGSFRKFHNYSAKIPKTLLLVCSLSMNTFYKYCVFFLFIYLKKHKMELVCSSSNFCR